MTPRRQTPHPERNESLCVFKELMPSDRCDGKHDMISSVASPTVKTILCEKHAKEVRWCEMVLLNRLKGLF
jgi:hypothetical protein